MFHFFGQVSELCKNFWSNVGIAASLDQFHSLINFIADPIDLDLEDQCPKRRGLKLLELVYKLLSLSQVLLIARFTMSKQVVCELSDVDGSTN